MLFISGFSYAGSDDKTSKDQSHVLVSMRMIGHQVLLSVGDSTTVIRPVVQNGDQYVIGLGAKFGFHPDSLSSVIDSVVLATQISKNYVVEFVSCDSNLIVHSYEVGEYADVLACRGRPQLDQCYDLYVTLLDADSTNLTFSEPMMLVDQKEPLLSSATLVMLGLLFLCLIGVIIFLISQKYGKNKDPNVIQIGEFLFNKRNMNLTIREDKIELTGKEADLLQLLSDSPNDTVGRDDILKSIWGDDGDYVGRTLDVFISKLRKKLVADSNVKIVNIRGIGYKLVLNEG